MSALELYRTFQRVAELASFTLAAEHLGLPRSTVSEHVRLLEARLGTRLLQRTTRRVQVTPDGERLLERCRDLLEQFDELETLFAPDDQALSGRIRVDLPIKLAGRLIIPALPTFCARHPEVDIELSTTDRRVDLVREGFDCVLRIGSLAEDSLVSRPLGALEMVNVASPAYLARYGTPERLEDLAGHRLIHYVGTLGARSPGFEYQRDGREHSVPMAGHLTVNNTDAYDAACVAGLGLIQAPRNGLREHLAQGRLVEVLPAYRAAPMPVSLVYPHRRHQPQRVRVFMEWLAQVVRGDL